MKKILFVSHEYNIGGSSVSLLNLIEGMQKCSNQSMKIDVLIPRGGNVHKQARDLFLMHNVSCKEMLYRHNFKLLNKKKTIINYLHDIWNLLSVLKIFLLIKRGDYDILCSNSTGVDVGARAAKIARIPHIFYVREFMEKDHGFEYRNKSRMKKLLEESEYCIFISKAIQDYYCNKYKLKSTIQFYDGFMIEDYYICNHGILCNSSISFVQVGYFSDGKGTLNTIMLLQKLKERGIDNWTLELIGDGSEEYVSKMKKFIKEYHLEGQVIIGEFATDIKGILDSKDILIMNSRAEGFGRVTIEGMLAGCLVIGRNAGGTAEIMTNRVNGITFDDEEQFLKVVQDIYKDRKYYRELAQRGQEYALEKSDCVNVAKKFIEVVEKCLI